MHRIFRLAFSLLLLATMAGHGAADRPPGPWFRVFRHDPGLDLADVVLAGLMHEEDLLFELRRIHIAACAPGLTSAARHILSAREVRILRELDSIAQRTRVAGIHPFQGATLVAQIQIAPGTSRRIWLPLPDLTLRCLQLDHLGVESCWRAADGIQRICTAIDIVRTSRLDVYAAREQL